MAILDIVMEGDPRLRQKATKIRAADASLRKLADDMRATMLDAEGVGLAGPQIGVMRRIIVVRVPADYDHEGEPEINLALLNPEIVKAQGRTVAAEGCLSMPGWVGEVPRAAVVTVKAMNLDNRDVRIKARGHLARVLQHEIDHLDGVLFTDRVEDRSTIHYYPPEEAEAEEKTPSMA